jgi:hypothetical protein
MIVQRAFRAGMVLVMGGVVWFLAEAVYLKVQSRGGMPPVELPAYSASTPPVQVAAEAAVILPAQEDLSEIIERPIFSPSRRPVEVVVSEEQPAPPQEFEIDLVGIVIWQSERFALIRTKDQTVARVPLGGSVAGWQAVDIAPQSVLFRSEAGDREVRLKYRTEDQDG